MVEMLEYMHIQDAARGDEASLAFLKERYPQLGEVFDAYEHAMKRAKTLNENLSKTDDLVEELWLELQDINSRLTALQDAVNNGL